MTVCQNNPGLDRANGCAPWRQRPGFTLLEILVALGILLTVLGIVARTVIWGVGERDRKETHQRALETAANVLEAARVSPWDKLNADWAKSQKIPEFLSGEYYLGQLTVRVEAEPARPFTKRVTVVVQWQHGKDAHVQSVQLVGLFSARAGKGEEKK